MRVFTDENGMLSIPVSVAQMSGLIARSVKYIANSAAKNMSSLDSQTIVPTEVMFGRLIWAGWVALIDTCVFWQKNRTVSRSGLAARVTGDDAVFVLRDGFMSPPPPADAPASGTPMGAPAFPEIWPRPAA